ncbi:MAG: cation:proton antiporter [Acidobacteriota bacterium]
MHESAILTLALLVLVYGLLSRRLGEGLVTPPLAFVGFGMLLAPQALHVVGLPSPFDHADGLETHAEGLETAIHWLGELTLIIVLFADATQIDLRALKRGAGLPLRLLALGMPLTVALGAAAAAPLVPGLGPWELALLGAVLAPTDAALGQTVVTSPKVPLPVRQGLSAESGLNDGIAVPLVVIFASLAGIGQVIGGEERTTRECVEFAIGQVTLGPLVGWVVGAAATWALGWAIREHAMDHAYHELAGIAIALIAFNAAGLVGGNGFIAAFVAGLVLGASKTPEICRRLYDFAEAESQLLMLLTFFLVGLGLAWPTLLEAPLSAWIYALLSLTVLRMLPVALALARSGESTRTVLFVAWFGPRGLASILFGILILEELHVPNAEQIVQVVLLTVLLSVVAHGVTAAPLTRLYARGLSTEERAAADAAMDAMLERPGQDPVRKRALTG